MTETRHFDVLVIGAGPAGLAAACCAAEAGRRVGVVDDNATFGGQIWRGAEVTSTRSAAAKWFARVRRAPIEFVQGRRVVGHPEESVLLGADDESLTELHFRKLILATGARERFLPFPGWTLPGVAGAGGLQALVKSGLPITGKRVVVAGSGPLLLAVAAYLRRAGAIVPLIAEQALRGRVLRLAAGLLGEHAKKLAEAARLKWELRGVRYLTDCWPMAAVGAGNIDSVRLRRGDRTWEEPCDYLACGFGLVPNIELPMLLGCELEQGRVRVDELQRTSIENVFAVGEVTGIGGLEPALIEGEIAGLAASEQVGEARRLLRARHRADRFAEKLEQAFALRDELRDLADAGTIVCRCEDVTCGELASHSCWRSAKLQTRCGMGPCQGRVCGAATEFLYGWGVDSVRPPLFPVSLEQLAEASVDSHGVQPEGS